MQISYPVENLPTVGTTIPVADGIEWLRMPLPFALDHVNLWLLADAQDGTAEFAAVDTGIALDAVKEAWQSVLASLPSKRRLTRQIVTHFHPDHLGLAAWLQAETGAALWMTQGDYLTAQVIAADLAPFDVASMLAFFRQHGLDEARLTALEQRGNAYRRGVPAIPATFHRLSDGDTLTIGAHSWRVIVGYGHAPEHASLYCATLGSATGSESSSGVLIAGDMLLPRISTNISAYAANPQGDPLGLFLQSIERLTALPADTLVLPAHGSPFRGLHARVAELQAHHAARCADLLVACSARPQTAAALLPRLFGRPIDDPHQTMFAMGEAIAHLNYLERQRQLEHIIENGIIRYALLP